MTGRTRPFCDFEDTTRQGEREEEKPTRRKWRPCRKLDSDGDSLSPIFLDELVIRKVFEETPLIYFEETPQFVLFGSSIVQFSFGEEGWGAILADIYARKADIFMRGYAGWNSRQAVEVLDQVFPKDETVQPSLVIVYFGGNDSVLPSPDGLSPHVPLSEYVENMRKIAIHLKSLSEKTRIIFLTAPPVNEVQILQVLGTKGRTNELCKKYADACVRLCREMNIKVINLCTTLKQRELIFDS
ncbi:hypothetical protein LXL04_017572 [Taraxacum kok-saghyz]